jgi:small-conductance mechanosensitive channel
VFGVAGLRPLAGLLGAELSVGALSVSLGDVLVFALTVWLSFARPLRELRLEEDVFTGAHLPRRSYAISSLVRYTMIFFGFLVALAASGIEFGKLTVVAGLRWGSASACRRREQLVSV